MNILSYQGSQKEQQALTELSQQWADTFWSGAEILKSLHHHRQTLLLYAGFEDLWNACLLAQNLGSQAELLFIFVRHDKRGIGLARGLMESWIASMQDLDIESIFLEVRPSNRGAIELYASLGFKQISRRKSYYANGEDAMIMQLELKT